MSQITTHILDTARGCPAAGIPVTLYRVAPVRVEVASGFTNPDGRIPDLLKSGEPLPPGPYTMRFETGAYFTGESQAPFYPHVEITFHIADSSHYHIPLLISPFGYTTYRGS